MICCHISRAIIQKRQNHKLIWYYYDPIHKYGIKFETKENRNFYKDFLNLKNFIFQLQETNLIIKENKNLFDNSKEKITVIWNQICKRQ